MSTSPVAREKLRPRTIYLLNQANLAVRMQLEQELRTVGLTGIQYTVLSIIGSRDGISSAELSRRFFVTPQSMGEIVSGLERRGLLKRHHSPHSKRILTAHLTAAGQKLLEESDAITDRIEQQMFQCLPDEDFAALRRIASALLSAARSQRA